MSVRTIIGGVGAAVGFAIGGPAGAQWGWAIGSVAGNIVDPMTVSGPTIGEIAQQTSQEGGSIPIVFGISPPITGNVIATSPPNIVRSSSGGKGGPRVVSESVYRTYAIGVCEGPIPGFMRVWRNNILLFDGSGDELVSDADNATFLETARFFLGDYAQNPSPDLEAIFGVGTTAAHRGIAYMVMVNEDVTDMGGAIPQWQFQIGPAEVVPVSELNLTDHSVSVEAVYPAYVGSEIYAGLSISFSLGRISLEAAGSEDLYAYSAYTADIDGDVTGQPATVRTVQVTDQWYSGTVPPGGPDPDAYQIRIGFSGDDDPELFTSSGYTFSGAGTWQDFNDDIGVRYTNDWVFAGEAGGAFQIQIRDKVTLDVLAAGTVTLLTTTSVEEE